MVQCRHGKIRLACKTTGVYDMTGDNYICHIMLDIVLGGVQPSSVLVNVPMHVPHLIPFQYLWHWLYGMYMCIYKCGVRLHTRRMRLA